MSSFHKITIILATYNRAHLIEETLATIINQTYTNWECLVIDDGSVDNTNVIIKRIIQQDKRFKYFKRPEEYKKGLPGCRNFGLDLAIGEYIIFFDDDDIVHPQNLEICVEVLNSDNIYFCRYHRDIFVNNFNYQFNLNKNYKRINININYLEKLIKNTLPFNSCAVMWKKECFENNRFVEKLMYAEEWELYSRILSQNFNGVSIDKTLFYGRKHENSNTGEFYKGNKIRITSKKLAIKLVAENLAKKKLLNYGILNYLIGLAIGFRDKKMFNELLEMSSLNIRERMFFNFKNFVFPLWKIYKKL